MTEQQDLCMQPDAEGRFGRFGGKFVSETLMASLEALDKAWQTYRQDPEFLAEFKRDLKHFVGRPSSLYFAEHLTRDVGGAKIYLKREDLNHTGAHKINNTSARFCWHEKWARSALSLKPGSQHGVATATVCARFGMQCIVYMGADDIARQALNVYRMKLMGAEVRPVTSGSRTLKDALNDAMRDWVTNVDDTFYIIGTVAGPHPYPEMVRDFQRVVGVKRVSKSRGRKVVCLMPSWLVSVVAPMRLAFSIVLNDKDVRLIGVEAGGLGVKPASMRH